MQKNKDLIDITKEELNKKRERESKRILDKTKAIGHDKEKTYLRGYADALEYVSELQKSRLMPRVPDIDEYLP